MRRFDAGRAVAPVRITTVKRVEVYANDGKPLPIDVMMSNMRYFHNAAVKSANLLSKVRRKRETTPQEIDELTRIIVKNRSTSQEYAKDAAPYFHPRLESITIGGDVDNPLNIGSVQPLVVQFYDPTEADPGVTDADYSVVPADQVRLPEAAD